MIISRRQTLKAFGATSLVSLAGMPNFAFANVATEKRFVVVFLRGAMDGLSAIPAHGDPDHERERNGIAVAPPGAEDGALDLDGFFGIHPWLANFHGLYQDGDMAVVHAVASAYRERSHFDGQNLVENGSDAPYGLNTGWLNRALTNLPDTGQDIGIAISTSMPVIMRGEARVGTWSPSVLPQPSADIIARVADMYADDDTLAASFERARAANVTMSGEGPGGQDFPNLMRSAATFLKDENGPRVAFVSSGGWDTHAGQMGYLGPLNQAMNGLNAGIAEFKAEIGDVWDKTTVLVVTEFGRTVAMNGSNGTDHGTAGAAFVVGGAVNGGRVLTDWPGLKQRDQYEGRDLRPTTDMRSLIKGVLRDHLGIDEAHLERVVFPDSREARPLDGLIRT